MHASTGLASQLTACCHAHFVTTCCMLTAESAGTCTCAPAPRRATSEVLQQLHAREVLQEQGRFKRWQAACEAWRTLRSRHAVAAFCQHVRQDLSEPPACLQLFARLRDSQQEAHGQLVKLCQRLHQLSPPHLNAQSVGSWVAEAKAWSDSWQHQLTLHLQELQQQELAVEASVSATQCRTHQLGKRSPVWQRAVHVWAESGCSVGVRVRRCKRSVAR